MPFGKLRKFWNRIIGARSTSQKRHANDPKRYRLQKRIGHGAFGDVHLAKDKETRKLVAIKKMRLTTTAQAELDFNLELSHINITPLLGHFTEKSQKLPVGTDLCLVLEYTKKSLKDCIDEHRKKRKPMLQSTIMLYGFQMFRVLHYLHMQQIVHRDVKPSNFLVTSGKTKILKICDFGSATRLVPGEARSAAAVSKPYRAPELELMNEDYNEKIDIWAAGCVFAECWINDTMFRGQYDKSHYDGICAILGDPTAEEICEMQPLLTGKITNVGKRLGSLDQHFARVKPPFKPPASAIALLKRTLQFKPSLRASAIELCGDPFFAQLRQHPSHDHILYNFSEAEIADIPPPLLGRIVPARCRNAAVLKKLAEYQYQELQETAVDMTKSFMISTGSGSGSQEAI